MSDFGYQMSTEQLISETFRGFDHIDLVEISTRIWFQNELLLFQTNILTKYQNCKPGSFYIGSLLVRTFAFGLMIIKLIFCSQSSETLITRQTNAPLKNFRNPNPLENPSGNKHPNNFWLEELRVYQLCMYICIYKSVLITTEGNYQNIT